MGDVYLAEHPVIGKRVALKVIHSELSHNRDVIARFYNEARAVNSVGNKHVIKVHDFGKSDEGEYFFVMEYLEGKTLARELRALTVIPPVRMVDIAMQIATGLQAAHQCGIIHRDLKPDNIMLVATADGSDFVKVLDFGLAKFLHDAAQKRLTGAGVVLGTPQYMSPEASESRSDIDQRSDIYCLGILLYQMATGQVPFDGEAMSDVLVKQVSHPPHPPRALNSSLTPALEAIILKCLQKRPEHRFDSMASLKEALADAEGFLRTQPIPSASPIVAGGKMMKPTNRTLCETPRARSRSHADAPVVVATGATTVPRIDQRAQSRTDMPGRELEDMTADLISQDADERDTDVVASSTNGEVLVRAPQASGGQVAYIPGVGDSAAPPNAATAYMLEAPRVPVEPVGFAPHPGQQQPGGHRAPQPQALPGGLYPPGQQPVPGVPGTAQAATAYLDPQFVPRDPFATAPVARLRQPAYPVHRTRSRTGWIVGLLALAVGLGLAISAFAWPGFLTADDSESQVATVPAASNAGPRSTQPTATQIRSAKTTAIETSPPVTDKPVIEGATSTTDSVQAGQKDPETATVRVRLVTRPYEGAAVYEDSELKCAATPCTIELTRDGEQHTFVITHPKAYDSPRTVVADIDSDITVEMKRRKRRRAERRARSRRRRRAARARRAVKEAAAAPSTSLPPPERQKPPASPRGAGDGAVTDFL